MKLLCLLFFVVTLPLLIFLTTILYGGITRASLKNELVQDAVYKRLGNYIEQITQIPIGDEQTQALVDIVKNQLTPSYMQKKTETTIDTSAAWITGKTTTPPSLSLKEVKQDILEQNPDLLITLQNIIAEMKHQAATNNPQGGQIAQAGNILSALVNNDFSLPLTQPLQRVKKLYKVVRIAQPVLLLLSTGSLLFLLLLNHGRKGRLRWFGAACLIGGLAGFGALFVNAVIMHDLTQRVQEQTNQYLANLAPLGIQIMTHFVNVYSDYQRTVSIVLLIVAVICFGTSWLIKNSSRATI